MRGQLFIDGIDAYTQYGIGIADGGYNGLVQFQAVKTPDYNDWPEEDGIEVDLSDPKLQNKSFNILFYGVTDYSIEDLLIYLDEQSSHVFEFREIGITKVLRFSKINSRRSIRNLRVFELEFIDDSDPFRGYIRQNPIRLPFNCRNAITIDDIPLSDYGLYHIDGLIDKLVVIGDVKKALTIDEPSINFVIYDSSAKVVYNNKDITLNLILHAPQDIFWNNWNVFFYDLTRPNVRGLYYIDRDSYRAVFYKSCSISRFTKLSNDYLWCNFNIVLTFCSLPPRMTAEITYVFDGATPSVVVEMVKLSPNVILKTPSELGMKLPAGIAFLGWEVNGKIVEEINLTENITITARQEQRDWVLIDGTWGMSRVWRDDGIWEMTPL